MKPKVAYNATQVDSWLSGLEQDPPVLLSENEAKFLIQRVREILQEENNVQPVPFPVTIAGDIHGQFHDLLQLFKIGRNVPNTNYLFLGDYVDRGLNSVETFLYLLLLKLRWPAKITLLRGNHESRQITQVYGFYDECIRKYGNANVWRYCTELFDYLALAAVVDGKIFCVHGGLSPSIRLIDQLRLIHRVQEIPHNGAFGDSVWSDPDANVDTWAISPRGAGWLFGESVTDEFCHLNDIDLVARAHQLALEGFQFVFPSKNLVTVWSAPNYCYRCGNVAAIMKLDEHGERDFLIFRQVDNAREKAIQRVSLPYFL